MASQLPRWRRWFLSQGTGRGPRTGRLAGVAVATGAQPDVPADDEAAGAHAPIAPGSSRPNRAVRVGLVLMPLVHRLRVHGAPHAGNALLARPGPRMAAGIRGSGERGEVCALGYGSGPGSRRSAGCRNGIPFGAHSGGPLTPEPDAQQHRSGSRTVRACSSVGLLFPRHAFVSLFSFTASAS